MGEAAHLNSLILQEDLLCNSQPGQSIACIQVFGCHSNECQGNTENS